MMTTRENRLLFVEFAGLPGSGKTAVGRALADQLKNAGIQCAEETEVKPHRQRLSGNRVSGSQSRARKVFRRVESVLRSPGLTWSSYQVVLRAQPFSMDRLRRVDELLALNRLYEALLREGRYQVVVLDEGVVHQIFSLLFGTVADRCEHAITDVFRRVYRKCDSLVVYFDLDARVCMERFSERDRGGRFHRHTAPHLKEHFLESSHYPRILECLSRAGAARFCSIDASDDVPTVAGKISDRVKEFESR